MQILIKRMHKANIYPIKYNLYFIFTYIISSQTPKTSSYLQHFTKIIINSNLMIVIIRSYI
jgi:hypothetical protein